MSDTLDQFPTQALVKFVGDMLSDDCAISLSTFAISMHPALRQMEPIQTVEYACQRFKRELREKIARNLTANRQVEELGRVDQSTAAAESADRTKP